MKIATTCAILAALAVAGCSASPASSLSATSLVGASPSSTAHAPSASAGAPSSAASAPSSAASAQSSTAPATAGATAAATAGATATQGTAVGNITIASAADLQPGPMKITPVYCGKLSAAQQEQFGTTAAGGMIYRYANHSDSPAAAKLDVGFTEGTTIAGENYAGTLPNIAPGHSAEAEVDAIGITGQDVQFTGCTIKDYVLATTVGVDPVSYAG